jgi:tetratricopeptide (TPR) repeat protein
MRKKVIFSRSLWLIVFVAWFGPGASAAPRRSDAAVPKMSQQPPEMLKATIDAVDRLRLDLDKKNRAGRPEPGSVEKQISFTLQEAKVLISLGQAQTLKSTQKGPPAQSQAFGRAQALLSDLLSHPVLGPKLSPQQRGTAHRLRGTAAFYSNDYALAQRDFDRSLVLDPNSPDAPWAAFMAAEEYFEQSDFSRALELYGKVISMSQPGARMADLAAYKRAWCLVNLNRQAEAEVAFVNLVRQTRDKSLGVDASRDLAFFLARVRSEAQLLELYEEKLAVTKERGMAYLRKALATLEQQGRLQAVSPLRDRAFALETDPAGKVAILLDSIQGVAKEYASLVHAQRLLDVLSQAKKIPAEKREPLEAASERVCRVFSETHLGKAKTPERIEKAQLSAMTQKLISEHLRLFPASKRRIQLQEVWLDVCELDANAKCLVSISETMLADPQLQKPEAAAARTHAQDARMLGLEKLAATPEGAGQRKKFMAALAERLADPAAKNAAIAGARLAQIQVEQKQFDDAIETLAAVLRRSPTQEYWYSLKWAQLQAGKTKDVMAEPQSMGLPPLAGAPDPRLRSVLAEASLKLAADARGAGEVTQMGQYILKFEQLANDPAKANVARDEWMSSLFDKKAYPEVIKRLAEFPESWHQRQEAGAFKGRLLLELINAGQLQLIGSWLLKWPASQRKGPEHSLALLGLLYWGGVKSIPADRVRSLDEIQRNVWLSTSVVSNPDWARRYFSQYPAQTPSEKGMDTLSKRLSGLIPVANPAAVPAALPLTDFERAASRIVFNPGGGSRRAPTPEQYTQAVQSLVVAVRAQREAMVPALKGKVGELQVRMLAAQKVLEQRAASAILSSPIPAGVTGPQLEQYQAGIKQLASEFEGQVRELDAAQMKLDSKLGELKATRDAEERNKVLPPLPKPDAIVAPSVFNADSNSRNCVRLVKGGNTWGALMELERLRAAKLAGDDDYWSLRAWVLASSLVGVGERAKSEGLRRYLHDELSDAGQTKLIEMWRREGAPL